MGERQENGGFHGSEKSLWQFEKGYAMMALRKVPNERRLAK